MASAGSASATSHLPPSSGPARHGHSATRQRANVTNHAHDEVLKIFKSEPPRPGLAEFPASAEHGSRNRHASHNISTSSVEYLSEEPKEIPYIVIDDDLEVMAGTSLQSVSDLPSEDIVARAVEKARVETALSQHLSDWDLSESDSMLQSDDDDDILSNVSDDVQATPLEHRRLSEEKQEPQAESGAEPWLKNRKPIQDYQQMNKSRSAAPAGPANSGSRAASTKQSSVMQLPMPGPPVLRPRRRLPTHLASASLNPAPPGTKPSTRRPLSPPPDAPKFPVAPAASMILPTAKAAGSMSSPAAMQTADYYPWTGSSTEDILSELNIKTGHFDRSNMHHETSGARSTLWPILRLASASASQAHGHTHSSSNPNFSTSSSKHSSMRSHAQASRPSIPSLTNDTLISTSTIASQTNMAMASSNSLSNSNTTPTSSTTSTPPPPQSALAGPPPPSVHPLAALSMILVLAGEKRRHYNPISGPSTFKPPPRMMLNEARREAWLRDLSNPEIPLRKLSRTIPHGLRDRAVLSQCLSKKIPVSRAVWLVKCIGANEMRAFRRKGTSGTQAVGMEQKWARDWTLAVREWVNSVMFATAEKLEEEQKQNGNRLTGRGKTWGLRMRYTIRFTIALYGEGLLDRDMWLNSIVEGTEQCTMEMAPIWILLVKIWWCELTRTRRCTRRLLGAVQHLEQTALYADAPQVFSDLLCKLAALRTRLNPLCCDVSDLQNRGIASENSKKTLYTHLDHAVKMTPTLEHDCSACFGDDLQSYVNALLEYAASMHGGGSRRRYLVVRLLAHAQGLNSTIEELILTFFARVQPSNHLDVFRLFAVIGDLARIGSFSVGSYLQWLVAHGSEQAYSTEFPCHVALLLSLPTSALPRHIRNLWQQMAKNLIPSRHLLDTRRIATDEVQKGLAAFTSLGQPALTQEFFQQLPSACTAEIGFWLQQQAHHCNAAQQGIRLLRATLLLREVYCVPSLLSSILKLDTGDTSLSIVAETVLLLAPELAVLGVLESLAATVYKAYLSERERRPIGIRFFVSLRELTTLVPFDASLMNAIKHDHIRLIPTAAAAMTSPMSDAAGLAGPADVEGTQDIERILLCAFTSGFDAMYLSFASFVEANCKAPSMLTSTYAIQLLDSVLPPFNQKPDGSVATTKVPPLLDMKDHTSRLHLAATLVCRNQTRLIFKIILAAFEGELQEIIQARVLEFLQYYIPTDLAYVWNELKASSDPLTGMQKQNRLVTFLSLADPKRAFEGTTGLDSLAKLCITKADELSLPFCQLALQQLRMCHPDAKNEHTRLVPFVEAIQSTISSGCTVWRDLLSHVDPEILLELAQDAQKNILSTCSTLSNELINSYEDKTLRDQFALFSYCASHTNLEVITHDTSTLMTLLDVLRHNFLNLHSIRPHENDLVQRRTRHLVILLPFLNLHRAAFLSSLARNHLRSLLELLSSLLTLQALQPFESIVKLVLDTLSHFSDGVSEESRIAFWQAYQQRGVSDSRFTYLFGPLSSELPVYNIVLKRGTVDSPMRSSFASTNPPAQPPTPGGLTVQNSATGFTTRAAGMHSRGPSQASVDNHKDGPVSILFPLRMWELLPDATPYIGENDTSLSLSLFEARRGQ